MSTATLPPTTTQDAPVRKMLDLSSRHLPYEMAGSDARFTLTELDGVTAYELTYGWLMSVPANPTEHIAPYLPDYDLDRPECRRFLATVLDIQRFARSNDCDWVLFDLDAPTVPDLILWDW